MTFTQVTYMVKNSMSQNSVSICIPSLLSVALFHTWLFWAMTIRLIFAAEYMLSHVQLCDPWIVAHQAPLSVGFSRQE